MNKRILLTLVHDFIIFVFSFFAALWIRLDFDIAISLVKNLWLFSIFFSISNLLILKYFGLYLGIWRYASLHEIFSIIKSLAISTLILVSLLFLIFRLENVPRSFPVLLFIVSLFGVTAPRIFYRLLKDKISKNNVPIIPVYLSGKIESVENYIRMTNSEKNSPYNVIGIIAKKNKSVQTRIHNVPIVGSLENFNGLQLHLEKCSNKNNFLPQRIIVTDQTLEPSQLESLYIFSKKNGLAISELPRLSTLDLDSNDRFKTNPIVIEDILGRKQNVQDPSLLKDLEGKFKSFGLNTVRCDGNNVEEFSKAFNRISKENEPSVIILDTVKGSGVSFMEGTMLNDDEFYQFHSGSIDQETYNKGIKELIDRLNGYINSNNIDYSFNFSNKEVINKKKVNNGSENLINAYSKALINEASSNERIIALDGDLILDTGIIELEKKFPNRFFE